MSTAEIILIIIGAAVFLLGYFMPARKKDIDEEVKLISEDEIRKLIAKETEHIRDKVADIVEETVSYSVEKTERSMERLTNEKIMAINEYSDTVLEEIHKNHKEVVFLYDMLNDKHDTLMTTIGEATQVSEGVKQTLKDAEETVHEAMAKADDVLKAVDEASARINDVLRAADDAVKGVWDAQNAARVAREAAQEAIRIASDLTETRRSEGGALPGEQTPDQEEDGETADNWITSADLEAEEDHTELSLEQEFKPIRPKRVEIIHEPDDDLVPDGGTDRNAGGVIAPKESAAPQTGMERAASKRLGIRKEAGADGPETGGEYPVETPNVDLQFAKDNGRNSNERILDLHKAGKSNMAIAKELGLGLGEVKLVIDLFEGM